MSDLLREVDDAIRAEQMKRLWDEHKSVIVTGIAALILGTATMTIWNNYKLQQNERYTGQVLTALSSKDPATALAKTAKDAKGTSKVVAYLNEGALHLKSGNKQKALDAYTKAVDVKSSDDRLRDLAVLQKTNLILDLKADAKTEDLIDDLKPIADNKKSPWQGEALFMTAFLKGEKNKDYAGAVDELKTIAARDDITESIKQRSNALQSVYELKLQEKK